MRLDHAAPAFDHAFERLQGAARNDRSRDHHAAGELAFQRQECAPAEHENLRDEAEELGDASDPEIAVQCGALHCQRVRMLISPVLNTLLQHAHRIDHLRVAR